MQSSAFGVAVAAIIAMSVVAVMVADAVAVVVFNCASK